MEIDFGNVVNRRQATDEDNFLRREPRYETAMEFAYDCRGHQAAQLIHLIGEAVQRRDGYIAAELCAEAERVLAGLRSICMMEVKLN